MRVVAGFPAGGAVDLMARFVAESLSRSFHQQFYVDNRPGAAGNLAAELLAKASPDGYTLGMMTIGSHAATTVTVAGLLSTEPQAFVARAR